MAYQEPQKRNPRKEDCPWIFDAIVNSEGIALLQAANI